MSSCRKLEHRSHAARRWRTIFIYGITGSLVIRLFGKGSIHSVYSWLARLTNSEIAVVAVTATIWVSLRIRKQWISQITLRSLVSFPPCWIGALVGVLLLTIWEIGDPSLFPSNWLATSGELTLNMAGAQGIGLVVMIMAFDFYMKDMLCEPAAKSCTNPGGTPSQITTNWDALKIWFADDREITTINLDAFGHSIVAKRISSRLTANTPPTIAVIGPRGSGKTSIACMVEENLKMGKPHSPRVVFVRISLWPFTSAKAAVRGILEATISELSNYADTTSIATLPWRYLSVIELVGPLASSLALVMSNPKDPRQVLGFLEEVASATDLRIAIWIDDLERYEPKRVSNEHNSSEESLSPIQSLLFLLDRCPSISVILATESLHRGVDIDKISRYVEHPPKIRQLDAWRILSQFQDNTVRRSDQVLIEPVVDNPRKRLQSPEGLDPDSIWLKDWGSTAPKAHLELTKVMHSPRAMKLALRLSFESWELLKGEVNFDDILAISAIRAASPRTYSFIDSNIERFRGLNHSKREAPEKTKALLSELGKTVTSAGHESIRESIEELVHYIFDSSQVTLPLQGFGNSHPQDYWNRYSSGSAPQEADSDQRLLALIRTRSRDSLRELAGQLVDETKLGRIKTFEASFKASDVAKLLDPLCEHHEKLLQKKWPQDQSVLKFLAKLLKLPGGNSNHTAETLTTITTGILSKNMSLALDVRLYLGLDEQINNSTLFSETQIQKSRKQFTDALKELSRNRPRELVNSLRNSPQSLYQSCWGFKRIREKSFRELPFTEWESFASDLISLGIEYPGVMTPQIVPFFCTSASTGRRTESKVENWAIDADLAFRLFDRGPLQQLLEIEPDGSWDAMTVSAHAASKAELLEFPIN